MGQATLFEKQYEDAGNSTDAESMEALTVLFKAAAMAEKTTLDLPSMPSDEELLETILESILSKKTVRFDYKDGSYLAVGVYQEQLCVVAHEPLVEVESANEHYANLAAWYLKGYRVAIFHGPASSNKMVVSVAKTPQEAEHLAAKLRADGLEVDIRPFGAKGTHEPTDFQSVN